MGGSEAEFEPQPAKSNRRYRSLVITHYQQNPRTAGRVIDGLASIVTPDDNKLHTLNPTATHIWERARSGCSVDELVKAVCERFDVSPEQAARDVEAFCADLLARGILEAT